MSSPEKITMYRSTYLPPGLLPGSMGLFIPISHGPPSQYESPTINYFQEHRTNIMQMPPGQYGIAPNKYSPKPDIVAADRIINMERMLRQKPLPLTQIDKSTKKGIEDFYMACQQHRDQYRDHTGKLHPLDYFRGDDVYYQCAPDLNRMYLKYPPTYVTYDQPYHFPVTMGRMGEMPPLPNRSLRGRYTRGTDQSYLR